MKTKTHFAFRVDIWDDTGDSIVEHIAGVDDFEVAEATYRAAIARWPAARITLRQGARVVWGWSLIAIQQRRRAMLTLSAKVEARACYSSGSLTTGGSSWRSSPSSFSSSSSSSSLGSRGGIVLPMMLTTLQSTNQMEIFSGMGGVMSAPVWMLRDTHGRMLARGPTAKHGRLA
jgi:hypothetical protein